MPDSYNAGSSSEHSKPQPPEEQKTKTEEVFDKHRKNIDEKIEKAKSDYEVKESEFGGACDNYSDAVKKLEQAQKAVKEYTKFSNCVSSLVGQDVVEIESKINNTIEKSGEVKTKLDLALDAVKLVKDKMMIVNTIACKLEKAIPDACNADQYNILTNPNRTEVPFDFLILSENIIDKARQACNYADDAYEVSIKVSAAHAFTNVDSLKDYGTNLKEKGIAFKDDVTANLAFNIEKMEEAQVGVTETIVNLSKTECAKYNYYLNKDGLEELNRETYEKPMATIGEELRTICHELEETFTYVEEIDLETESGKDFSNNG